jgi:nucleotide-binding universal stress UspA family protein
MTTSAFTEVVVPLDLVHPCDAVLALSSTLARRAGVGVRLVIVASPGLDHTADEVLLRTHAAKVDAPAVAVEVIESNDVVSALLDTAGPTGLLVVETRAHGSFTAIVLGSTTNALLRATTRPVLLVGPSTDPAAHSDILQACFDTLEAAEALLPVVGCWARDLGLRLRLVHARLESDATPLGDTEERTATLALHATEQFGVPADVAIVSARTVPKAIVDDADDVSAAIIAVGMRSRSGILRVALGSVAVAVAHAAHAAVLAVPVGRGAEGQSEPPT